MNLWGVRMFCDLLESQLAGGTPALPGFGRWFMVSVRDLESRGGLPLSDFAVLELSTVLGLRLAAGL